MQSIKTKLQSRKFSIKTTTSSKTQSWQEYAIQICKDFSLQGNYRAMIFRYAKQNMCYLQGRVENVKEKFGEGKLKELGHYLIASFRKSK